MPNKTLEHVVVAFDIDNTLMDRTGEAYRRTVVDFLLRTDLRLAGDDAFRTFEQVRSHGDILERLGLGNPIHQRDHPHGMALLCLTHCANPALLRELDIHTDDRPGYGIVLRKLRELDYAARHGPFDARLEAEITLRNAQRHKPEVRRLRREIERVAGHSILTRWSDDYRAIEREQPLDDCRPLLDALSSKGATPVVVSEGCTKIQLEKLDRLGLSKLLQGRVLITDEATNLPEIHRLDDAISSLIDERKGQASLPNEDELAFLWYYRCLIDTWSAKTPSFYARCLHAIRSEPTSPESGFNTPIFVQADRRREDPLYFVMVGDRYDKDVEPLLDLLGGGIGLRIRLRMGKYARLHSEDELPPDRRPDKTFTDWDSLARFLTNELRIEDVKPTTTPPDIVPRNDVHRIASGEARPTAYIKRGLDSPYEAVRLVATAVAEMMR